MDRLILSVRYGDQLSHLTATNELETARKVFRQELSKLYGASALSLLNRTVDVVSAIDLEKLAEVNVRGLVLKGASEFINRSGTIASALKEYSVRRKIALITQLARKRRQLQNLSLLCESVFGRRISDQEQTRLATLLTDQRRVVSDFAASPPSTRR